MHKRFTPPLAVACFVDQMEIGNRPHDQAPRYLFPFVVAVVFVVVVVAAVFVVVEAERLLFVVTMTSFVRVTAYPRPLLP